MGSLLSRPWMLPDNYELNVNWKVQLCGRHRKPLRAVHREESCSEGKTAPCYQDLALPTTAAPAAEAAFHVTTLVTILELIATVRADTIAERFLVLDILQNQISLFLSQLA